jgi:hypothetical protein
MDRHRQRPLQHRRQVGVFGDQTAFGQVAGDQHNIGQRLEPGDDA